MLSVYRINDIPGKLTGVGIEKKIGLEAILLSSVLSIDLKGASHTRPVTATSSKAQRHVLILVALRSIRRHPLFKWPYFKDKLTCPSRLCSISDKGVAEWEIFTWRRSFGNFRWWHSFKQDWESTIDSDSDIIASEWNSVEDAHLWFWLCGDSAWLKLFSGGTWRAILKGASVKKISLRKILLKVLNINECALV